MDKKHLKFIKAIEDLRTILQSTKEDEVDFLLNLLHEKGEAIRRAMKKYNIIYADPPWRYNDRKCNGACEHHYNTMKLEDICNLPIKNIAADDCVLLLWTTYPMLQEAMQLINAWGFKYKTIGFQWIKQNKSGNGFFFGLGRWTRGNTEPCLIAVKGKPKRVNNSISQLIFEPIGQHSKKPDIVREKIVELLGDLPRVELFARNTTEGWDVWGNEVVCDLEIGASNNES